jgi:hypothetical protein
MTKIIKIFEDFNDLEEDDGIDISNCDLNYWPLDFNNVYCDIYFNDNNLNDLEGAPNFVKGNFSCENNELTSLEGSPEVVKGGFFCDGNELTDLKGAPKEVNGNFYCNNNLLTSVEGVPSPLYTFHCEENEIATFEFMPAVAHNRIFCSGNPINEVWKLFNDSSKIELLNEYDALRYIDGEPVCVLERLNEFLQDIGKPKVHRLKGYKII